MPHASKLTTRSGYVNKNDQIVVRETEEAEQILAQEIFSSPAPIAVIIAARIAVTSGRGIVRSVRAELKA